jgi:hypothetical protein
MADSPEKRINGGNKTAEEFLLTGFMWRTIRPIERNTSTHQRISFRYDHSLNQLERPRQKLLMHSYLHSTFTTFTDRHASYRRLLMR